MKKFLPLLLLALGCRPVVPVSNCYPGVSRCAGPWLELCSPQRRWRPVQNCSDVTPGTWTCQTTNVQEARCDHATAQ